MMTANQPNTYTVFAKPWRTMSIPEVGELVAKMGFDGIELPVRPGFQVEPGAVLKDLPKAAKQLAEVGVKICSVAGSTNEATIAACAESGVPILRIMAHLEPDEGYLEAEERYRRKFDALAPRLGRYGVTVGIQNHCGRFVSNALGLMGLIGDYDSKLFAAVWDPGHEALNGQDPELAIDVVWSHLCMVNLKNAYWQRVDTPEVDHAQWKPYWTLGRDGLASWPRVARELERRDWSGVLCLTAEYAEGLPVAEMAEEDLTFAKSLFSYAH
jgi:sugar phosphate isomerase/epimerase